MDIKTCFIGLHRQNLMKISVVHKDWDYSYIKDIPFYKGEELLYINFHSSMNKISLNNFRDLVLLLDR